MVINRAIQSLAQKKLFQLPKYTGNPINWLIADAHRRRRRRGKGRRSGVVTFRHVPLKRKENNTGLTDISSTPQVVGINDIAYGTSADGQRTEERITSKLFKYSGNCFWEFTGGASNTPSMVRLILCTALPDYAATGLTTDSNIYDKRDFPEIGHVYKDIKLIRKESTTDVTPIHITQNMRNIHFNYDGELSSDHVEDRYSRLILIYVSNVATTSKTAIVNINSVFRYHG